MKEILGKMSRWEIYYEVASEWMYFETNDDTRFFFLRNIFSSFDQLRIHLTNDAKKSARI